MAGYPGHLTAPAYEQNGVKPLPPQFMVVMNIANTLTHFLLGAVSISTILIITLFFRTTTSLKQHVILNVIGYIILMSQAVLSMNPHTGWAHSFTYQDKKTIHWVMQILGSILAITGSVIRIVDVNVNFTTAHGVCGLIALLLTILSLIGGVVNLYSSELKLNPNISKIGHAVFGSLTLIVAYITLMLGISRWELRFILGNHIVNVLIAFSVFALLGTLMSACIGTLRRLINRS